MTERSHATTPGEPEFIDLGQLRRQLAGKPAKETWRSLEELAETEEFLSFLKQEFPRETSWVEHLSRRDFLKLLAAPLALAGLSACTSQPGDRIFPYQEAPEQLSTGRELYFSTAFEMDGFARGLLVRSHEGRPIKIEGNPSHPASLGATDAFAQASLLSLYDPDRAQVITHQGQISSWDQFLLILNAALDEQKGKAGAGLRILTQSVSSPSLTAQIQGLLGQFPSAKWHAYDPAGRSSVYLGAIQAFGEPVETIYHLDKAGVIVAIDNDFVFSEPGSLRYLRDFSARRRGTDPSVPMSRLYVVESRMTTVGGFADHRLALRPSQIAAFVSLLAGRLGLPVQAGPDVLSSAGAGVQEYVDALAGELTASPGSSLIAAGPHLSPEIQALIHRMNQALGNVGSTITYTEPVLSSPLNQDQSILDLARDLEAGAVDVLVVLGGNPVYTAPADLNFSDLYRKARLKVYLGLYEDETAEVSDWFIPETHYLEMWGDTRAFDGTASLIQPLIEPLYGGRSVYEILAVIGGQPGFNGYDLLRQFWMTLYGGGSPREQTVGATGEPVETPAALAATDEAGGTAPAGDGGAPGTAAPAPPGFEDFWRQALRSGVIPDSAAEEKTVTLVQLQVPGQPTAQPGQAESQGLELIFEPDPSVWDGRFANNAWLQELPKPLSKLTWDNAAVIGPETARQLELQTGDVVELSYQGRSLPAPVLLMPGQPEGTVLVTLGYGRRRGGKVLQGHGFNAYQLRTLAAPWSGNGLEARKTGRKYAFAITQNHHSLEGRELAREARLVDFQKNPELFHRPGESPDGGQPPSMYPEYQYPGHAWGMTINLGACIGCNACVVACMAENNIPVVGKEQVQRAREMHWLRIDSYFSGEPGRPKAIFQPVLCMHCEKAPCEPVCPVEATSHSSEGLNEMTYNRCVGTRYCSNNCPYKVRRFNFYQFADLETESLKLMRNPNVSVRARGVMEKCTYCVQRIQAAKIQEETTGEPIQDHNLVTACQQVCPTQAIVFGDINNPDAEVAREKSLPQNYGMLAELGTQPRTSYLAKLTNPKESLPERF